MSAGVKPHSGVASRLTVLGAWPTDGLRAFSGLSAGTERRGQGLGNTRMKCALDSDAVNDLVFVSAGPTARKKMAAKQAPWRTPNPKKKKKGGSRKLSPAQKVRAKRSARKAGRPYPNLVDNMLVARKSKKRKKGRGSRSEGGER